LGRVFEAHELPAACHARGAARARPASARAGLVSTRAARAGLVPARAALGCSAARASRAARVARAIVIIATRGHDAQREGESQGAGPVSGSYLHANSPVLVVRN